MRQNRAVAASVGLLVCGWTFVSFSYLEPRIMTWITFLTWASFFAAGGGVSGFSKSVASGVFGTLASVAVIWIDTQLQSGAYHLATLSLLLGFLGWVLCTSSAVQLFSCIPASFIGAAAFFGAGSPMNLKLVWLVCSIIAGSTLGLVSQRLAEILAKPNTSAVSAQRT